MKNTEFISTCIQIKDFKHNSRYIIDILREKGYNNHRSKVWLEENNFNTSTGKFGFSIQPIKLSNQDSCFIINPTHISEKKDKQSQKSERLILTKEHLSATIDFINKLEILLEKKVYIIKPTFLYNCLKEFKRDEKNKSEFLTSKPSALVQKYISTKEIALISTGENPKTNRLKIINCAEKLQQILISKGNKVSLGWSKSLRSSDIIESYSKLKNSNYEIIFILHIPGVLGNAPTSEVSTILKELENRKIPFQILNYSTNHNNFSLNSTASSIALKTGCTPFKIIGSEILDSEKPTLIGIDLSHKKGEHSRLSIVVQNSFGQILFSEQIIHNNDETVQSKPLLKAIEELKSSKRFKDINLDNIIIFRDGRFFPNENFTIWRKITSEINITLLEIIKNPTPYIFSTSHGSSDAGSVFHFPDCPDLFINPIKSEFLNHTRRIRIRKNPKKYSQKEIAKLLIATCYFSHLGLQPSINPAPIYWAHGFGSKSETNLQFRGFSL
jgi:hypothetical protein